MKLEEIQGGDFTDGFISAATAEVVSCRIDPLAKDYNWHAQVQPQ